MLKSLNRVFFSFCCWPFCWPFCWPLRWSVRRTCPDAPRSRRSWRGRPGCYCLARRLKRTLNTSLRVFWYPGRRLLPSRLGSTWGCNGGPGFDVLGGVLCLPGWVPGAVTEAQGLLDAEGEAGALLSQETPLFWPFRWNGWCSWSWSVDWFWWMGGCSTGAVIRLAGS